MPAQEMTRVLKHSKPEIFREIKRNFWADDGFPKKYAGYFGYAAQLQTNKRRSVQRKLIRIHPGSPWENGYDERFNGTLRREVLNAAWFTTTGQAQIVIKHWLRQYNHTRPHQALNMRPRVPETILEKSTISGTGIGGLDT
ncbi:MAG: transposase [Pseudomonadota bacterium]